MKKNLRVPLALKVVLFIVGFVVLVAGAWQVVAHMSLPDYAGEKHLPGIKGEIEIVFTEHGIPHVYAGKQADLYYAMGWLHASERLLQMEITKKVAQGRIAEIFGPDALAFDQQNRSIGAVTKARAEFNAVADQFKVLIEAYVRGVNDKIDDYAVLPPELLLLSYTPEPWEPVDLGTILIYQTWYSNALMNDEERSQAYLDIFPEYFREKLRENMLWSPATVKNEFTSSAFGTDMFPYGMAYASNSFSVRGPKSQSGKPIYAMDPHLQVNRLPGFWYMVALHEDNADGLQVAGITAPGLPFVAMGHNGRAAWGFTVSGLDIVDLYDNTFLDKDALTYIIADDTLTLSKQTETFRVAGVDTVVKKDYYRSIHGVVTAVSDTNFISRRWAGDEFTLPGMFRNVFLLNTVDNFADFRRYVTGVGALGVNWSYADSTGNIGYQLGVPVPVREFRHSFGTLPGDDPAYFWDGFVPLEKTPHMLNPSDNWLATCNNQPEFREDIQLPGFYYPYRIMRANEILSGKATFDQKDLETMQMDRVSHQYKRYREVFVLTLENAGFTELAKTATSFDGELSPESKLAGLYLLWWELLPEFFFGTYFPEDIPQNDRLVDLILMDRSAPWLNGDTAVDWQNKTVAALKKAHDIWQGRALGEFYTIKMKHLLSVSPMIDLLFDWGSEPYAYGGSHSALNQGLYKFDRERGHFDLFVGTSMRFVIDFANIDAATMNLPSGQSGHPYSPYYLDQFEKWYAGERIALPFSRSAINEKVLSTLWLKPLQK
jgi:penicillin amidase